MLHAYGISHTGLVRKGNEDGLICSDALRLFAVADGMGGHLAGEVASRLALEALEEFVRRSHDESDFSWPYGIDPQLTLVGNRLRNAIYLANRRVFRASESCGDYAGMGTTMTAALVSADRLSYAHVGDSRLYVLERGEFRQLTKDDSWVATILANEPAMSRADLARHPMRHVLTNVLGARDEVGIQLEEISLAGPQLFLICSDGLHGLVDDDAMRGILGSDEPLEQLGQRLLQAALDNGGHDNITAVLVRHTPAP
ncbi:MAG: serine/threonine-protein phosphatase [Acidobacteria bacterium]|nr:MAG: serine/threonine-protein phosphatase [Acidobacteriota bacterium]